LHSPDGAESAIRCFRERWVNARSSNQPLISEQCREAVLAEMDLRGPARNRRCAVGTARAANSGCRFASICYEALCCLTGKTRERWVNASFHNQPSVAFAAESERLGGTCASLLEYVRINRCSRYLNAYAVFPAPLCPGNLSECANGRLDQNRPLLELSPLRPKATRACARARDSSGVFLNPNSCRGF